MRALPATQRVQSSGLLTRSSGHQVTESPGQKMGHMGLMFLLAQEMHDVTLFTELRALNSELRTQNSRSEKRA